MSLVPSFKLFKRLRSLYNFRRRYAADKAVDLSRIDEFRNDAFPSHEPDCWLDRPDAAALINDRLRAGEIDTIQAEACRYWVENGYLVLPGLIDHASLDATWLAYEEALSAGLFGDRRYVNEAKTLDDRTLDPHLKVPSIRDLQRHPAVLKWTDLLLGRETVPFQTIMGHAGSQQAAHSDSIHMTTYPLGYLVANWIAFEDISENSGPLEYYPGSHKLPYLLSAEVGIRKHEFKEKGYSVYSERYEPAIRELCEEAGHKKEVFLAKKGDVLFWHANLVHGGSRRVDPDVSRKALVCHFFAKGAVTYHDLSGNLSRLHKNGVYAPVQVDPNFGTVG
jgi:ectoine hydroxylase-related dioxygenase (phytanoyl-CoA dioxygenase family)